ncbi:MAG: hypothetical protein IJE45_04675 [Bacilli bacterium]|nr:hypothetical protein [Bacilli bacterium]
MQNCYSDGTFEEYKKFRKEHIEFVNRFNELKKCICNSILQEDNFELEVIKGLYENEESIKDIAAFLNMTEYDVFFLAVENGIIKKYEGD